MEAQLPTSRPPIRRGRHTQVPEDALENGTLGTYRRLHPIVTADVARSEGKKKHAVWGLKVLFEVLFGFVVDPNVAEQSPTTPSPSNRRNS
jgi:hypothetical protein